MFGRAIAAVLFAAFGAAAAAETFHHQASGFECPDDLAGFRRVGIYDYEAQHPGLGVACKYHLQPYLVADVYIYTAGLASVPADSTHPAMLQLREQTVKEIEQFAEQRGEKPRKTGGATIEIQTKRGAVAVLYDGFVIDAPGGTRDTWVWLWSARNHVMKIRMTRPPAADPAPARLREFYEAVVRLAAE